MIIILNSLTKYDTEFAFKVVGNGDDRTRLCLS